MDLDAFETLARRRRSVRSFRSDPIDRDLLERVLDAARWAPSGYNLQSTRIIVVTDDATRTALRAACLDQRQVAEAPVVAVFLGDRAVAERNFEQVLAMEREAGAISPEYEAVLRRVVPLAFSQGPLGLGWLWKSTLLPVVRLFRPVPSMPAVEKRHWVTKQAMLAAMSFMLAATAAGLATVPMEGFDDRRVRRVLGVPRRFVPVLVVPVGYAADGPAKKTRLPLKQMVEWR